MVQFFSQTIDEKINTPNYLIELTFKEYLGFARDIIANNKYQRKRVRSSMSIYSQLKEDLKSGCIIPPVVLAIDENDMPSDGLDDSNIIEVLKKSLILDGLQRTYTMLDAYEELTREDVDTSNFLKNKLRAEVYGGINRFGLLYRMLTLNTGQTPMTLRHQIEILYSDYNIRIEDVTLLKEVQGKNPTKIGEYKFQDIIEGFISYLQSSYLPITRSTVLEIIKTLETISNENIDEDLFKTFVNSYYLLSKKMDSLLKEGDIEEMKLYLTEEASDRHNEETLKSFLFADNILALMAKPQVMAGFGAGLSSLKNKKKIDSITRVLEYINGIEIGGEYTYDWFLELNNNLDHIKQTSSKIGNSQRMYFSEFFRLLFDESGNYFLNLYEAAKVAMEVYLNKMG